VTERCHELSALGAAELVGTCVARRTPGGILNVAGARPKGACVSRNRSIFSLQVWSVALTAALTAAASRLPAGCNSNSAAGMLS
jgi:hypothetical protein